MCSVHCPAPRTHSGDRSANDPGHADCLCFGPYRLYPRERTIEREGLPLSLGSRALDILVVLAERAGEVVSQRELIARVWRDLVVLPSNLRVHVAALRRALGDSEKQPRYIANIPGLGYCFVASVERAGKRDTTGPLARPGLADATLHRALPAPLARMVGREEAVRKISADLLDRRFVSIVGPGGMGKTTVAVCVAHALIAQFAGAVCFVDLGAITDPALVAATIASALGLAVPEDGTASLVAILRAARMLLMLDNCEHVIEPVASLAEQIFCQAPDVHLLATSRETLRVEGEYAYPLPPLETPPPDVGLTAAQALSFPAVKLFTERAGAGGSRFELRDQHAATVAGICRRLDGIALAIELAAGRVATYGVEGTAMLLANRLALQWRGRRTAQARHRTLRALMDWSYDLLSPGERLLLQRLSLFSEAFTLDDARAAAAAEPGSTASQVILGLDSLVSKSLVIALSDGKTVRYRLLETVRDYAAERSQGGDDRATGRRHPRVPAGSGNRWISEPLDDHDAALCLLESV